MKDISVIIPLYKGNKYVSYWIEKVQKNIERLKENDIFLECELLFVNDYPDEEIQIKGTDKLSYCVKLFDEKCNRGIHGARVFGLEKSEGAFVVFLDQDDYITDDYLYQQHHSIGENAAVVCNGNLQLYCMDLKIKKYSNPEEFSKVNNFIEYVRVGNQIASPGQVMLRREAIPEAWIRNIMKKNGADDLFLWLLMLRAGAVFSLNNKVLYTHVEHSQNESSDAEHMQNSLDELCDILENKNLVEIEDVKTIRNNRVLKSKQERGAINTIKIYDKWYYLKQCKVEVSEWLIRRGYKKVVIYGLSFLGYRLYEELKGTDVEILAGIDQRAAKLEMDIPVFTLDDPDAEIYINGSDLVIVTVVMSYPEIYGQIRKCFNVPVYALNEILDNMVENGA